MPELSSWSNLCGGVLSGSGPWPVPSTEDAAMGIVTCPGVVVAADSGAAPAGDGVVLGVGGGTAGVGDVSGDDAATGDVSGDDAAAGDGSGDDAADGDGDGSGDDAVAGDGDVSGDDAVAGDGSGDDAAAGESRVLNKESPAFKFLTQKRPGDRSQSKRALESDAVYERYLEREQKQKQMETEPETGAVAAPADGKMRQVQVGEAGYKHGAESVLSESERGSLAKMAMEHVAKGGSSFGLRIGRGRPGARVGSSYGGMQPVTPMPAVVRTPGQMLMEAAVQAVLAVGAVDAVEVDKTTLQPVTVVYDPAHAEARMTVLHELIFYNKSVVRATTRAEGDYCQALHCTELEVLDVLKLRELVLEMIAINKDGIWPQNSPYGDTWAVYCVLRQNGLKEPSHEKHLSPTPTSDKLWYKRYVFSHDGASTWAKYPDMDGCTEAPRLPVPGGART